MYADDTDITSAASDLNVIERDVNSELRNLNLWLMANKLSLNIAKTEFMSIGSGQRLRLQSNQQIQIQIEGKNISQVEKAKSLGVFVDDKFTWKTTWTTFLNDILWHWCPKKT